MEQVSIVGELMQGKEFAKKLFDHLNSSSSTPSSTPSSSHESNEALIEKILSTYEKALTMLNNTNIMMKDSSHCSSSSLANGSTKNEVLEKEVVAPKSKEVSKKRKTMSMWTKQVKVCLGTAIGGSMEDGHSWRKYGQKDILGAKFPRGYYRCTHRHVQGCLATKQVQKSDENPNVLEITYKGRHTCIHQVNNHLSKRVTTTTNSKPNMALLLDHHHPQQEEIKTEQPHETILTFGSSPSSSSSQELEVKIDDFDFDFDLDTKENIFSSLYFTSPSSIVSEIESFSPEFISPTTNSESNSIFHFQTSDSEFSDNVSAPTSSVSNSPIIAGLDFHSFDDKVDFDNYFSMNS